MTLTQAGSGSQRVPSGPSSRWLGRVLVVGDLLWLVAGLAFGQLLFWSSIDDHLAEAGARVAVLAAVGLWLLRRKGLHRASRSSVVSFEFATLTGIGAVLFAASVVLGELVFSGIHWGRAATSTAAATVLLIAWRSVFRGRMRAFRLDGRFVRPVMVVGINDEAKRLHRLLGQHPDAGFRSLGVVGDREDAIAHGLGGAWAGPVENAVAAVIDGDSTGVVLVTSALPTETVNAIARAVQEAGGHVHLSSGLAGIDHRRFTTQPIAHEPLLYLEPPSITTGGRLAKRAIDVVLSSIGLVISAPILLFAAIAIKIEDRGPVVFRQRRVGRGGEPFTILKLRTMCVGAEAESDELAELNRREGPLFKLAEDPRVTRVGRVLRAMDIDELPQLVNVLRGQMSLVGPRPALPHEVERFNADLKRRTNVLPGLTGLWQVESRDNPSFEAYQRLDLFYVENWSIALDLTILLLTVESKIVQRFAKRHDGEMLAPDGTAAPAPAEPAPEPAPEVGPGSRPSLPID